MPNAWIDSGTFWRFSLRFCAVTMISPSSSAAAATCASCAIALVANIVEASSAAMVTLVPQYRVAAMVALPAANSSRLTHIAAPFNPGP